MSSILKKEKTYDSEDFITYVVPKPSKQENSSKKLPKVDITILKQKLEKFLEKIRRKKVLQEIKRKLEENLNPESNFLFDDESDEEKETEEKKAYLEIHKMLKLRNAKNEPYFLELEELFCFKSIIYEALFYHDQKRCLAFRNFCKAIKRFILLLIFKITSFLINLSKFRVLTYLSLLIVTNRLYTLFTMAVILINSIEIGLNGKNEINPDFFYGFYILEIALKICAYGFFILETSYLRDKWNILDILAFVLTIIFQKILAKDLNFMPIRLFRFVDYFEIKKVQYLLEALFNSLRFLVETLLIFAFFVFISAIISLHIFSGILHKQCFDEKTGFMQDIFCGNSICPLHNFCSESYMSDSLTNFDDIFHSILLSLRIVTLDNWTDLLNSTQMAYSTYTWFYFFIVVSLGNFFFMNLIVAALKINFSLASELMGKSTYTKKKNDKLRKKENPMIIQRKFGKYQISLKRYNLKLMKMFHLHKEIDLASKILSHYNNWTIDTKASSVLVSIKSYFSKMVRASFFRFIDRGNGSVNNSRNTGGNSSEKVRSNSEILPRRRKKKKPLYNAKEQTKSFINKSQVFPKSTSIINKKKSTWIEPYLLKSNFITSKKKLENIKKLNKELENKYLKVRIKYELEFKSASLKDVLPSKFIFLIILKI